jgi:hypothetical protein
MTDLPATVDVAAWRAEVARELGAYDAAWHELESAPGALWSHPAHARIDAARERLRALLALRDATSSSPR